MPSKNFHSSGENRPINRSLKCKSVRMDTCTRYRALVERINEKRSSKYADQGRRGVEADHKEGIF